MNLIDLTRRSMGWNNPFETRHINEVTTIAVHHTATASGDQFVFENHWRNLGWRNGGYSEIILRNGDVQIYYVPEVVTNGVRGHNRRAYHISMVGNGQFTLEQLRSLESRVQFNMNRFNVAVNNVLAHREFSNQATTCLPMDMNEFRHTLRQTTTSPTVGLFTVTHAISGFLTAEDARLNRSPRTTVQSGNYHVFREYNI